MKKFLALLLALVMALSLFACGKKENDSDKAKVKVGFITLHDENSTYDLNFINAAKAAIKNLGLTDADYILKTNIPEGQECLRLRRGPGRPGLQHHLCRQLRP